MSDHCFDALRYLFNGVHTNYLLRPEPPMSPEQREVEEARLRKERSLSRHERPGVTRRTIA